MDLLKKTMKYNLRQACVSKSIAYTVYECSFSVHGAPIWCLYNIYFISTKNSL